MSFERRWGAVICVVGLLAIVMITGPLSTTRQVLPLWILALCASVLVGGLGVWFLAPGGSADKGEP